MQIPTEVQTPRAAADTNPILYRVKESTKNKEPSKSTERSKQTKKAREEERGQQQDPK